jgi:hypothetical protein
MTATRSLTLRTTARSWAMNTMVSPWLAFRSSSRLRIWAWTDTSRADTGSSQMSTVGSRISERAIEMRWHWPPENSCGRRWPAPSGSMPTERSVSATLPAAPSRRPQMARPSPTISLTRRRGFSEEIGSW